MTNINREPAAPAHALPLARTFPLRTDAEAYVERLGGDEAWAPATIAIQPHPTTREGWVISIHTDDEAQTLQGYEA